MTVLKEIKQFLELSTIHGLYYISTTEKWSRLFWTLTVIAGFSGAGYLIYTSFYNWEQSPISTTVETLPISQLTFPNVTVCPPKNSFLNLIHDMKQAEKVEIDKERRNELFDYALDIIQYEVYKVILKNLSKVEDPKRYYNWYHGYTEIKYPYLNFGQLLYKLYTSTTLGNISTQYFGEKLDSTKVDSNIAIEIRVYIPRKVNGDKNTTITFDIEKETMKKVSGEDKMSFGRIHFDADRTHWSDNFTGPYTTYYEPKLSRTVSADDIQNLDLELMPGFRVAWKYNKPLEPIGRYSDLEKTKQYVR